jgi:hypothetical protein
MAPTDAKKKRNHRDTEAQSGNEFRMEQKETKKTRKTKATSSFPFPSVNAFGIGGFGVVMLKLRE